MKPRAAIKLPCHRTVSECASSPALWKSLALESARALAHSKTRSRRMRVCFGARVGLTLAATLAFFGTVLPALAQGFRASDELWIAGDFDGDGIRDIAVVARDSGLIRLGRGQRDGSINWDHPYPGDLPAVTSIAADRFDTATRDSLALVSPTANRAVRWWLNGQAPEVQSLPVSGLGPALAAAGPAGSGTNRPQLAVVSTLNSGPTTDNLHLLRAQAGSFQANVEEPFSAAASFLGRADLGASAGARNFVLRECAGALRLELYDLGGTNRSVLSTAPLTGMTAQARALSLFVGAGVADLLAFEPGQSNFIWLRLTASNSLSAPVAMPVAGPISEVFPISTGATWRIAVRETGDRRMPVYDFSPTGGAHLVLQSTLTATGQDTLLGVAPGVGGELVMLAGDVGGTRIQRTIRYAPSGASYVEVSRQSLPTITPWSGGANVLLLAAPPFLNEETLPVARLRVGDWSKSLTLGSPPGGGTVVADVFRDAAAGLGDPVSQTISVPAAAHAGLINEYRPNVSVLSWAAASADPLPEVRPTPLAGTYPAGVIVQLATVPVSTPEPGQIFYRANSGLWLPYLSTPTGPLRETTSLDMYWRRNRDGARGPIFQAVYTIRTDEPTPDCDHDGVPDFVEVLYGLDPCGGPDADHDGASDLAELLNGTNPALATNRPPGGSALNGRLERTLYVALSPHSHSGGTSLPPVLWPSQAKDTNAVPVTRPTKAWLFDPFGQSAAGVSPADTGTLPFAETRLLPLPGETFPAAPFTASDASFLPELLVAVSEDHFDLKRDDGTNVANRGRELVGFVLPPTNPPTNFEFHRGTNPDAAEASRWLSEALAFYQLRESPTQTVRLDYLSTVEVLLTEYTVGQLLYQRGAISTPRLTLTPFRAGESLASVGEEPVPAGSFIPFRNELLRSLETRGSNSQPAYLLTDIRNAIHSTLLNTNSNSPDGAALRDLAAEFYRFAALPVTPSTNVPPPPLDALRSFLQEGTNHQSYVNSSDWRLTTTQLNAARSAAHNLTNVVPALVEQNWLVRLNGDLLHDRCVGWTIEGSGQPLTLVDARGQPYPLKFGFALAVGTRVSVRGYAYSGSPAVCAGLALRPTELTLLEVPAPTPNDSNGNGVSDDLERFYFGALVTDRNADRDHDGVPDLVEILLGTDPNDGSLNCSSNKMVECGTSWSFDPPAVTGGCCTNLSHSLISSNVLLETPDQSVRAGVWLISDCCSNFLTCTQLVTVVHTLPPVLTCASNKSVQSGTAWNFDPPAAVAVCCASNAAITIQQTLTNGSMITRTWLATDCWGNASTCSQVVTIIPPNSPALITSHPTSQTVTEGSAVSIRVTATGTEPLAYQWFRNGQTLAGRTIAELAIAQAALADAGTYFCRVTNNFGQAVSSNAVLTVRPSFSEHLLVYDSFEYSTNTQVVGQNGGSGWTGAWAGGTPNYNYFSNQLTSIMPPGFLSYATAGGHAEIDLPPNSSSYIYRSLDVPTTNVNELWFSAVLSSSAQSTGDRFYFYVDDNAQTGVEIFGAYGQPAHWTIHQQPSAMGPVIATNEPALLVVQMTNISLTTHQFWLYVNPPPGVTTPSPAASWTLTGTRLDRIKSLWYIVNGGRTHHAVDEIRIATSFGYLLPNTPVTSFAVACTLVNGQLRVRISGAPGRQCRLDRSTDLKVWQAVLTNSSPDGVIDYVVPTATVGLRGFYRAVLLP